MEKKVAGKIIIAIISIVVLSIVILVLLQQCRPKTEPVPVPAPATEPAPAPQPEPEPEPAPVVEPAPEPEPQPEPAPEPEPIPEPQPEPEPEPQPVVESEPEPAPQEEFPVIKLFEYYGYEGKAEASRGEAIGTYPDFITSDDVMDAVAFIAPRNADFTKDMTIRITEPGRLVITYSESYGAEDLKVGLDILEEEIRIYLERLLASWQPEPEPIPEPEPVPEPEPQPEPEPEPVVEPEPEPVFPLERVFAFYGYSATVTANQGEAQVVYPDFIPDMVFNTVVSSAIRRYPESVGAFRSTITGPGSAVFTYTDIYGAEEFKVSMDILEEEIRLYLEGLFASLQPAPEPEPEPEPLPAVPEAPDLDWFVYTELADENAWNDFFNEDVDWSQFMISGQEVELPDGEYFATLFVNDTNYGTIEIDQVDSVRMIPKAELQAALSGTLSDEFFEDLFSDERELYPLDYIGEKAEDVQFDSTNLVVKLFFNSSQVPVQTISMSNSSYSLMRQNYNVTGNVVVEPAAFSWQSNISMFLNAQYNKDFIFNSLSASLSTSNTISFWNITFSLPISLNYMRFAGLIPSVGSWNGYIDFPDNNLRLSFGNVGNSGFTSGSPFGFILEKNYGFGTGTAMSNQYTQNITLTEDSVVEIKVNGNSVYQKTLSLGTYKLTDFAFVQGSNDVEVTIHPLSMGDDTSQDRVERFNQNYDTSLMAKGESVWRFGASIRKVRQNWGSENRYEFGFLMPGVPTYSGITGLTWMENIYDPSGLSIFWDQTVGLAHAYTQTHSFSLIFERNGAASDMPGEYSALFGTTVSGTLATAIGTT